MKFGKEFASQMVPEWQEAYMDYKLLKAVLKDILQIRQRNVSAPMVASTPKGTLRRKVSLYRAFSGLTGRYRGSPQKKEDEVILVSAAEQEGSEGQYRTMFLMPSDEGAEHELVFFRRLDDEFNKVINFYKKMVEQVMKEAEELSKQMDVLIALRVKVENPMLRLGRDDAINLGSFEVSSSSIVHPSNGTKPGGSHMDVIQEVEMTSEEMNDEEEREGNEPNTTNHRNADRVKLSIQGFKPASLELLDHVKINLSPETPVSTLKEILMSSTSDLSFSTQELRKAEESMMKAFSEFYQKLRLLKSYCFLNQLAFSKIMKKYDKITSRNASKSYLEMVDNSYLGSCDEVARLMERVEATFIKHFANGNRRKGMNTLRPKARRERHRITFFLGFFSGCSIALVVAIIVLIHVRNIFKSDNRGQYMDNIFPLYSLFGLIILHMLVYSGNIYFWRRYRVNYPFIFGFKQGTELGYREVFLLSSVLAVLTLAGVISNLDMEMEPETKSFSAITELVPLVIGLVTLPDFFVADQLTSQVQAFRSLEFYICYYGWGDFKRRSNKCNESKVFKSFYYIVAIIPFWLRLLQCVRRMIEEKDKMQGLNGVKYFSIIIAVAMRTTFELRKGIMIWRILAAASSGIATILCTYWDIALDWGLLRRNSKNPWLRDKLIIPNKAVYFAVMVLNVILRLAWMQTVMGFTQAPYLHKKALIAIVACLEIIRRGIWNFFRLENEHLNNVGKFRAFNSVPLPFNYEDDDKDG
ncbi:hypothetical protein FEM48_Zijuj04G0046900 [Ziziphus jujuba var. spinosa]|uniref:Phosphate transporter PHO1 homolog 9-like n=1 Tax=Ziziphus jujuba var. spinosa TaxID=714518 RepID=A0A978VHV3_ZIZJJ|nr:hypothetical protein FEM48_Zijuj04G0046900 [Ziziphus jujuba var. spinosa]